MPHLEADMTYTDFFKARTELVKALADNARSYIQISSAALALPLLFSRALLVGGAAKSGPYAMGVPWSLVAACLAKTPDSAVPWTATARKHPIAWTKGRFVSPICGVRPPATEPGCARQVLPL
jgi:hypothetical protein